MLHSELRSARSVSAEQGGARTMRAIVSRVLPGLALPPPSWREPLLIAITGLPCTGKTEITRHLAAHFSLIGLSTDAIRCAYGLPSDPSAHAVMDEVSAVLLKDNAGVIFDGVSRCVRRAPAGSRK